MVHLRKPCPNDEFLIISQEPANKIQRKEFSKGRAIIIIIKIIIIRKIIIIIKIITIIKIIIIVEIIIIIQVQN